ncbi:LabA-like NYN domain-containing protein [Calothrix sp. NIES-2100]|uniref:LabA-like NYN domain-containing protein n=1 Tax=Calothrix sp. NIES-2100 TaxID=1954172 RepID=UPI0030D88622
MIDTVFKKKVLGKTDKKASNQSSSFTDTKLESEATDLFSANENSIPNQGYRGRVIIFIDGSNLFYAASSLKLEIDYVKLLHYLIARDCLVHVFFYTGYDPTNEKQYKFLYCMRRIGFRVITKAVTQAPNSAKKANLDVEIAVDMMTLAQHCDTAVLVSGDGDFAYVVNAIAAQGVRVEVVGLRSMTSAALIDAADCYIDLAAIQQTIKKIDGSLCQLLANTRE